MKELVFADIKVGDTASSSKTVTEADIANFAEVSGDFNPIHVDDAAAAFVAGVRAFFAQHAQSGGIDAAHAVGSLRADRRQDPRS